MKKLLAIVLAVIIGVSASMNAFAASANKTYISDLVAVTAKDEADAKAQLEKDGYKLLANSNVNSSLKTGVYIGYKETENAEEAITDIAGMNMTGKFSYSDYKTIMEQNKEKIKETIDNFEPVIAEFQANYEEQKPSALAAYEAMNAFKDDDSGKLMGDYLIEYDFSEEAENKMTDTFMQANSQIILTIMQQASFAGDDNDDSMIERLVKTGSDGIAKKYKGLYPSVAKANQAMAAEYGDTAQVIFEEWNNVYTYICDVEKEFAEADEDGNIQIPEETFTHEEAEDLGDVDRQIKDYVNGMIATGDTVSAAVDVIDVTLYNLLNNTEYGDGTLLDFFKRPVSEVKKDELYPLVDAMSEGQRSQIEINGLKLTLEGAFSDLEKDAEESEEAVETVEAVLEAFEATSIYEGVDRSVFEDGVAFTSAATQHETLTGESWITKLTGGENEKDAWLRTMMICGAVTSVLISACIGAKLVQLHHASEFAKAAARYDSAKAAWKESNRFYRGEIQTYKGFTQETAFRYYGETKVTTSKFAQEVEAVELKELKESDKAYTALRDSKVGNVAQVIKCVSFVMLVVMLAVDAYAIYEYVTADELQEEKIPHHIMTVATTEYGEDYVYYQTVKNLKGEAADTNNHEADAKIGWLTLYTTKDKAAGNPILADNFKLQTGSSSFKEGTAFVHLFNESAALNLTDEKYTGVKDSMNGTYITFNRAASTLVGSVVTNGTAAIIGVGGFAVGALLGALITKFAGKKKKEKAPAEA